MSQPLSLPKPFFECHKLPLPFLDRCTKQKTQLPSDSKTCQLFHSAQLSKQAEIKLSFQEVLDKKIESYDKRTKFGGSLWFKKTFAKILAISQPIFGIVLPLVGMTISYWTSLYIALPLIPLYLWLQPSFDGTLKREGEEVEAARIQKQLLNRHSYKSFHPKGEWDLQSDSTLRSDRYGLGSLPESTAHVVDTIARYDLEVSHLLSGQCSAQLANVSNAFSKDSWVKARRSAQNEVNPSSKNFFEKLNDQIKGWNLTKEQARETLLSSSNSYFDQFIYNDPRLIDELCQDAPHYVQEIGRKYGLVLSHFSSEYRGFQDPETKKQLGYESGDRIDELYQKLTSSPYTDYTFVTMPDSDQWKALENDLKKLDVKMHDLAAKCAGGDEADLFLFASLCEIEGIKDEIDTLLTRCKKMSGELSRKVQNHPSFFEEKLKTNLSLLDSSKERATGFQSSKLKREMDEIQNLDPSRELDRSEFKTTTLEGVEKSLLDLKTIKKDCLEKHLETCRQNKKEIKSGIANLEKEHQVNFIEHLNLCEKSLNDLLLFSVEKEQYKKYCVFNTTLLERLQTYESILEEIFKKKVQSEKIPFHKRLESCETALLELLKEQQAAIETKSEKLKNEKTVLFNQRFEACNKTFDELRTKLEGLKGKSEEIAAKEFRKWLVDLRTFERKQLFYLKNEINSSRLPTVGFEILKKRRVEALQINDLLKKVDQKMVFAHRLQIALPAIVLSTFLVAQAVFSLYFTPSIYFTIGSFGFLFSTPLISKALELYQNKKEKWKNDLKMEKHIRFQELKFFDQLEIPGNRPEALRLQRLALELGLDRTETTGAHMLKRGDSFTFDFSTSQGRSSKIDREIASYENKMRKCDQEIAFKEAKAFKIEKIRRHFTNTRKLLAKAIVEQAEVRQKVNIFIKVRSCIVKALKEDVSHTGSDTVFSFDEFISAIANNQEEQIKNLIVQLLQLPKDAKEKLLGQIIKESDPWLKKQAAIIKHGKRELWLKQAFGSVEVLKSQEDQFKIEIQSLENERKDLKEKIGRLKKQRSEVPK